MDNHRINFQSDYQDKNYKWRNFLKRIPSPPSENAYHTFFYPGITKGVENNKKRPHLTLFFTARKAPHHDHMINRFLSMPFLLLSTPFTVICTQICNMLHFLGCNTNYSIFRFLLFKPYDYVTKM